MSETAFKCAMPSANPPRPRCKQECPDCQFRRTGKPTGQERVPMCDRDPSAQKLTALGVPGFGAAR